MPAADLLLALVFGLAAAALVEMVWWTLRRGQPKLGLRWSGHLLAFAVGLTSTLAVTPVAGGRLWKAAVSLLVLVAAFVVFALLDRLVLQRPWEPVRGPMVPKLVRDILRALVLAGAVLAVATVVLQYPLPAVLVSSTVLSAVIGLALQDVLKNVFAGMALELEKPVQRGDWLLLDGEPAQVMDTSWRSVRLRSAEGVELYEPNSTFSNSRVTSYGRGRRPVGFSFLVALGLETPPDRVKLALVAAARSAPGALAAPAPEAFVEEYGDSAIRYRLRVWTHRVDQVRRFRDGVNSRIWYALQREGLVVPVPIRTVRWQTLRGEEQLREDSSRQRAHHLLAGLDLFSALDDEQVGLLAGAAQRRRYDHGEVLVAEGDRGDSLFVVEQGEVAVSMGAAGADSSSIGVARMGPGQFFGEMSLLTGEPRSATVTAETPVDVVVLPRQALAPLLEREPHLAEVLSAAVARRQAEITARLEDRRARQPQRAVDEEAHSLLHRMRAFFKLGDG